MPKRIIHVLKKEWDDAKAFFLSHPDKVKYRKKDTLTGKKSGKHHSHSFFFINNTIFVVNNTKHVHPEPDLGKGAYSRIKYALTENGFHCVIKVECDEKPKKKFSDSFEKKRKIAFLLEAGQLLSDRKEINRKGALQTSRKEKIQTNTKFYMLLKYLGDRDLFMELGLNIKPPRPPRQNEALAYMLKVMMNVLSLHDQNILHCDLKPENFVVDGQKPNLTITLIDFDFSQRLESGEKRIYLLEKFGTPIFLAPEIANPQDDWCRYSFASDVYALGKMLEELQVHSDFYIDLLQRDHTKRPSLLFSLEVISEYLRKHVDHSQENAFILNTLAEYDEFMGVRAIIQLKTPRDARLEIKPEATEFKTQFALQEPSGTSSQLSLTTQAVFKKLLQNHPSIQGSAPPPLFSPPPSPDLTQRRFLAPMPSPRLSLTSPPVYIASLLSPPPSPLLSPLKSQSTLSFSPRVIDKDEDLNASPIATSLPTYPPKNEEDKRGSAIAKAFVGIKIESPKEEDMRKKKGNRNNCSLQ